MYRKKKRIPTIIVLLILSIGTGFYLFIDKYFHFANVPAKTYSIPSEVRFSNITDNSFTVSWYTNSTAAGTVIVSTNNFQNLTFIDDLDSDNIQRPRKNHYTTIKNLKENTSYSVRILTDDKTCTSHTDCPSFIQQTSVRLPIKNTLPPVKGSIISQDGKPQEGTIIYLTLDSSATLSGRSDSSGLWVIPLNNLYTNNLSSRPTPKDSDVAQITIMNSPEEISQAVTDVRSIRQNLTIPSMQLGKTYNFINLANKSGLFAESISQKVLGSQTSLYKSDTSSGKNNSVSIIFPSEGGDTTTDSKPRIRGTGPAGTKLLITVNSQPQIGKIEIDQNGNWDWSPPDNLPPGTHHVNIQGYDLSGNPIDITKEFIVLKSGEQVLGEATGSATLTPSPASSPSPSPTIDIISPTLPIPSLTNTPIPTTTPKLTSTPVPTVVISVSPPKTGTSEITFILIVSGALLTLTGIKLIGIF